MDSINQDLYEKFLKTVIDPSRAPSLEEFSKIDNLKKQYLADPKNFKFDTYASGRRTFPATMSGKAELTTAEKVPIAKRINRVLTEAEKQTVMKLSSAPIETPFGKSLLSYTPEGKIAGKAGALLRGLGKVAGPIGAALTTYDLGAALSEIQDKGAAKIAADYKKEQEDKALADSEETGDKVIEEMNPIKFNPKQYSPEERVKLKDILSKYRANPTPRSEK
jgi:hypothetical protein